MERSASKLIRELTANSASTGRQEGSLEIETQLKQSPENRGVSSLTPEDNDPLRTCTMTMKMIEGTNASPAGAIAARLALNY